MASPIITGGSVTYGETRKTGDYENRKIEITLSFNASDAGSVSQADAGAILDKAQELVTAKHLAPTKPVSAQRSETPVLVPSAEPAKTVAPQQPTHQQPNNYTAGVPVEMASSAPAKTVAAPVHQMAPLPPAKTKTVAPVMPTVGDILAPSGAPSVSDAALAEAIRKHNDSLQGKKFNDITTLIRGFSTSNNKSFTGIPQDRRSAFLTELAEIH